MSLTARAVENDDILRRIGQNDPDITTLEIRFSAITRESSCVDNQEKKCKLIATELIDDDNDDWDISDNCYWDSMWTAVLV